MARCDLHIHSFHSGKTAHVKLLEPMDSYNTPERIYRVARGRGMSLVTITDHDSIAGCLEFLNRHPDTGAFFISEEVTVPFSRHGYNLHAGVYDIREEDHRQIQRLRTDFPQLMDYLRANAIFTVWNHPFFQFPRGDSGRALLPLLLSEFDACEGINSALPPELNGAFLEVLHSRQAERARTPRLVAGSDAHSLSRIGHTWTEAPGDTPAEFFTSLRAGQGRIAGNSGRFTGVFQDAMSVYLGYFRDIAYRNEVHRDWSRLKKIRNGLGWAGWLPVFTGGTFLYSWLQFRRYRRLAPLYAALGQPAPADGLAPIPGGGPASASGRSATDGQT